FLIDLRKQTLKANMTAALLQSMEKHLARGNQVLVFLNRRGFCPVLLCHQCGWVANCKQCDAKMTLHHTPHRLFCHHCGYNLPKPSHCEACQHTELLSIGFGTERIEHFLKKYFPTFPVLRIDRDS